MNDLSERSYKKELLDAADIPFEDIKQNMKELNSINTWLGGHAVTVEGLKKLLKGNFSSAPLLICEIGCGGGDNLVALDKWCRIKNIPASFIGVDKKTECIDFAKQQCASLKAEWMADDYRNVLFKQKPDVIFSSLFCHHFNAEEIIQMLKWMKDHSATGFFINDLHRHLLAWHSIRLITGLFSNSYLVKNDAPLSVARGFTKKEWHKLLYEAGIADCSIEWKWAFRHLVTFRNAG